jgi:hypothetical protein
MKNKSLFLVLALLAIGALWSCKKQESQVTLEGGTPPVMSSSVANNGVITLDYYQRTNNALTLSWTNPAYRFNTGVSSQPISYKIEIDTLGSHFTNPKKRTVTVTSDLSKTFTQAELNDLLYTGLLLKDSIQHTIEVRVSSYLGVEAALLASNSMTFKVTPYDIPPKVAPPTTGKLFITGSAAPLSWMGGGDPEVNAINAGQKFTMISPTLYRINSVRLNGGQSLLFVPQYGDWGNKYGGINGNNSNNASGDEFKANGSDLLVPATTGNYKIEVNFKLGTFTITPA